MTLADPTVPDPNRSKHRRLLIIGTIIDVLLLPLAAFWGVMSVMASDAGTTPAISTYINVTISLPLAMIVAPIAAWIAYVLKRSRLAVGILLIPVAWAIASFALMFTL